MLTILGPTGETNIPRRTTKVSVWIPELQDHQQILFTILDDIRVNLLGNKWTSLHGADIVHSQLQNSRSHYQAEEISRQLDSNSSIKKNPPTDIPAHNSNSLVNNPQIYTTSKQAASDTYQLNIEEQFKNTEVEIQLKNMLKDHIENISPELPIKDVEYDMVMKSHEPVYKKGYPVPAHFKTIVDDQLKDLESQGIIKKAQRGDYISPGFIIGKKNGKHRLVVDYKTVNERTEVEGSIFPDVYQLLREIPPNQKYFTQIDLKHGYHQIQVKKESQKYTGFTIQNQHYIYQRMPFGLMNAPAFFQRVMFDKIGDLPFVKVFLDDILVFSQSLEEHMKHLQILLTRLQEHNIQLNYEKSHFLQRQVTYLGNIVSDKGMQADIHKVAQLRQEEPPKKARDIMCLLGLFNWFRPYIPGLSTLLIPITAKLQGGKRQDIKRNPIVWTPEDERIRQKVFDLIERQLVITNPLPNLPFKIYLQTHATRV
ncbi:hypothetical protein NEAUS06_1915 [Nematocida ausubeli]|nr:hypothetical protein NEAUS06_1915 [Nematocida ausubeli]